MLNLRNVELTARHVSRKNTAYTLVDVPSESNPSKFYQVDVTSGRCSCPAWTRTFPRKPCKHMKALGIFHSAA